MSRSYNFRNKDNSDNDYLKYLFGPSSFRGKDESPDHLEEKHRRILKNKGDIEKVPKSFKKNLNKEAKNKYNRHLERCLRLEAYDEILTPVIKKNHKYEYF